MMRNIGIIFIFFLIIHNYDCGNCRADNYSYDTHTSAGCDCIPTFIIAPKNGPCIRNCSMFPNTTTISSSDLSFCNCESPLSWKNDTTAC
jgi:hypothetical protein